MGLSFGCKMFQSEAWHKNVATDCIYSIKLGSGWGVGGLFGFCFVGFFYISELLYNLNKGFGGFCP